MKNKIFNKNFFEDWLKILNPDKRKEVRYSYPCVLPFMGPHLAACH